MRNTFKHFAYQVFTLLFLSAISLMSCNTASQQSENQQLVTVNKKDTVKIANMKFEPENIEINKGDTLIFINEDIVPHNVTEKDSLWQSNILNNGDVFQYVADKSYDYYCSLHLVMKGKITVK